ncbi:hypothetical protein AnigIFM62618_011734 [Aspergillus niger]|nr:hypothetical protein AnigIFM62618_011734 [Aspergillus niger]
MALISCVLYTCAEMLQGDVEKALRLYGQALQLILSWQRQSSIASETASVAKDMTPLLIRLGAAISITTNCSPEGLSELLAVPNDSRFSSLEAAQTAILKLTSESLILRRVVAQHKRQGHNGSSTMFDWTVQQCSLMRQLNEWDCSFAFLRSAEGHPYLDFPYQRVIPILLAIRSSASIIISICFAEQEVVYDRHMDQFRSIVEHAAAAIRGDIDRDDDAQSEFTFEADVGPPLFFTAVKCRDKIVRQTALELLRQAPKVQSLFKCMSWATLAETIIQIEEGSVEGIRERQPLNHTASDITTLENRTKCSLNHTTGGLDNPRGALPSTESVPSLAELVEVNNIYSDKWSTGSSVHRRQYIPEVHRVHEFNIFQARGTAPVAMSQQMQHSVILRFANNKGDPKNGRLELEEHFLPLSF